MADPGRQDAVVIVHRASTSTEAMVIRSVLESAGLKVPDFSPGEPFPMHVPPAGMTDADIVVLSSQAEDAKRLIADYLSSSEGVEIEPTEEEEEGEPPGGEG
jgi:methylmalonyl-CoA mutase cobalamin-binding subunit